MPILFSGTATISTGTESGQNYWINHNLNLSPITDYLGFVQCTTPANMENSKTTPTIFYVVSMRSNSMQINALGGNEWTWAGGGGTRQFYWLIVKKKN